MKTLQNKTILLAGESITYAQLMAQCLNGAAEGFSIDEMRRRIRVMDAIEKAGNDGKEIELEDHDYQTLVSALDIRWRLLSREIVEFVDYVQGV